MANPWTWDQGTHRYRNTQTGRFLGSEAMRGLRDEFLAAEQEAVRGLAGQLVSHQLTVQGWMAEMQTLVKETYIDSYVMAHGGRNTMTPSDWGQLGHLIRDQYGYLRNFAQEIASGKYNEATAAAAIGSRSGLYISSANEAYNRGRAASYSEMPALPDMPGSGNTVCRANCHCEWIIEETDTEWLATWQLSPVENCPDCLANAAQWNPLIMPKTQG